MTFPYVGVFSLDSDYTGNLGETHLALQGLQSELQDFLAQYIAKITSFQEDITRGLTYNEVSDTQRNSALHGMFKFNGYNFY